MHLKAIKTAAGYGLKVLGEPLGNARRLLDSPRAIFTGYWTVAHKCPNHTDTCWANLLIGWCAENPGNEAVSQ
jgi:hypothetical protein